MDVSVSRFHFIVAAVASFGLAGPIGALPAQGDAYWGSECRTVEGATLCVLSQNLVDKQGDFLAQLRVQVKGDGAFLQLLLPTGVHLGSGVFYAVDSTPELSLTYLRCDARICEASRALSPQEWTRLKRGAHVSLLYRPDAGSDPAILTASLAGLTAAAQGAVP